MTAVLLQPGVDGIDSIHLSRLQDWSPIATAKYPWASVYIGGDYGVISSAVEAAWRAGIVLNPNFERLPDAAKRGYSEGVRHARLAISQLLELGFLGEAPVIFSGSDTGFTDAELPAAMDYHRALVDVLAPIGWKGGAYGLRKVMEKLVQQPWWPADWPIWHWGGDGYNIWWWAWVKQWYGRKPVEMPDPYDERHDISGIPFAIDENTLFKPMEFWSGYGPVPPSPRRDIMGVANKFVQAPNDSAIWYTYDCVTRRHILDFLDLRSTAAQCGAISEQEAWGPSGQLSDDQLRAKVVAQLGAAADLRYFGEDVAAAKGGTSIDLGAIARAVRAEFRSDPLK